METIMEVGDIVHVKERGIGTIETISTQLEGGWTHPTLIARVVFAGCGDEMFTESDLKMKNGEWWER